MSYLNDCLYIDNPTKNVVYYKNSVRFDNNITIEEVNNLSEIDLVTTKMLNNVVLDTDTLLDVYNVIYKDRIDNYFGAQNKK